MSSMYTNQYLIGSTVLPVGLSAVTSFIPPERCNGGFFKKQSGGTLMITNGPSGPMAGATLYVMGDSEVIKFEGPAKFYLVAAGTAVTVGIGMYFSSPGSSQIAGG